MGVLVRVRIQNNGAHFLYLIQDLKEKVIQEQTFI